MKIDELILLHLYNKKEFSLQGIGTFRLNPNQNAFVDNHGLIILPPNAITFEYNPKVSEDAALIDTISFQTKKIKSLASSDLNSFVVWETQLLNIGMAFTLKGIGTLEKTKDGLLHFTAQPYVHNGGEKIHLVKQRKNESSATLGSPAGYRFHFNVNVKKTLGVLAIVIILFSLAWAGYNLIIQPSHDQPLQPETSQLIKGNNIASGSPDTMKITAAAAYAVKNSTPAIDTVIITPLPPAADTGFGKKDYVFKVVFLQTEDKDEALRKYNDIVGFGHSASMYTKDNVVQIAVPFNLPLADTSRILDSLDQYYSLGKGFVDTR